MKRLAAVAAGAVMLIAGCGEDPNPVSDARTLTRTARDGPMTESLPQTNHISADVHRWLHGAGYILEPPKQIARAISADEAIASARDEFGGSGATGIAVERHTVTTPDLGRLVNPGDPDSAVIPKYDHQQLWVIAFDVKVPENGLGGPQVPHEEEETNPLVPGTAVVFVDAITGRAPSAIIR